ncbi:MAG: aspartyl protease family protein [Saprospiraceae bacterium]|nr:aspartyl protease family protein [Saprospiraceae bacterium]
MNSFNAGAQKSSVSVLGNEDFISIPFQYNQGFIIVDVLFHYIFPLKFILDTGAEHTILLNREYTDILNVPYEKEIKVLGSDFTVDLRAWVVRNIPIQLFEGTRTVQNMIVLDEDVMNLGSITGVKIDGIIGVEFLKNFIVEIDYRPSMVRLYGQNSSKKKWSKYKNIPLEIYKNKPYLKTQVYLSGEKRDERLLLLDTGAALPLMLDFESDSLPELPQRIIKGVIGKGLSGEVEGYSGKISKLEFGEVTFENFVTSFQMIDSTTKRDENIIREGIIGNFILDNFHLIFDFPGKKLFYKKRKKNKWNIPTDNSGLVIYAYGKDFKNYYVHYVLENSPASKAGFQRGDIIHKIGIWPARFFSMEDISRKLSKKDKTINITIKRNTLSIKKKMQLHDLFEGPDK